MKKTILIGLFLVFFMSSMYLNAQLSWVYGGNDWDEARFIQQTADGGYIVAGNTLSLDAWDKDFWILKLFPDGEIEWQKTYGGTGWDETWWSIRQTIDGGYILAGCTHSFGAGVGDIWVLKLFSNGDIEWQKTYGGNAIDSAASIQQTADGGYIVAGLTVSFGAGSADFWIIKLSSAGDVEWQKTYGGNEWDQARFIRQTADGGYVVTGEGKPSGAVNYDFWVLKLFSNGDVEWQKTYGGSDQDRARCVQQTIDGGYIITGNTKSFGAGPPDFWVLKLSSVGDVEWQKTYGGNAWDSGGSVHQTADGGYIVAGYTESFGAGGGDIWILKLFSNGDVEWQKTYGGRNTEYGGSIQKTADGGYIVASFTDSFGFGSPNILILKLSSEGESEPAGLSKDSNATVSDTSISPFTTIVIPVDSNTFPQNTDVAPWDSNVNVLPLLSQYTLTIAATTGGTTNPSPGSYIRDFGTQVSVTAVPNSGYQFNGWSGDASGRANPVTITMDRDKSITANFGPLQCTLNIAAGTGGTTNPAPGSYLYDPGTQVSVAATASSGYQFSGWSGDATGTTNSITITMDSDKSVTANFSAENKKGGCFIATAAYGSPLHPHLDILRDFRDKYFMPNKFGQKLVGLYYKYSPYVAELIAKHKVLRIAVRIKLLPFIAFSNSMLHFGATITAFMLAFVFALPIFFIWFYRRK